MTDYWNNRPLTEREQRLRDGHRCIACGARVQVSRLKSGEQRWPFECRECADVRTRRHDAVGADYGAARASVQHAADAALGYSTTDCGVHARTATRPLDADDRGADGRLKLWNPREKVV